LSLPSPSNDYEAAIDMPLTKATWDAALTSVGARLRAAEAIRADFQALIDGGTSQALAMIIANVGPQITALAAEVAAAQHVLDILLSGNIPADYITETSTRVFVTPSQRTAIGDNSASIASLQAGQLAALTLIIALG
jgi:hypothetical protein